MVDTVNTLEAYDIRLKRSGDGQCVLIVDNLNLAASGDTIEDAYSDLQAQWSALIEKLESIDSLDQLPKPRHTDRNVLNGEEFWLFLKKTGVVVVVVLLLIGGGVLALKSTVGRFSSDIKLVLNTVSSFSIAPARTIRLLGKAARNMPPERLDVTRDALRSIVELTLPLAEELRPLITTLWPGCELTRYQQPKE